MPGPLPKVSDRPRFVANVAALANVTGIRTGDLVQTSGYTTAGDKGGDTLRYSSTGRSSLTAADGLYHNGPGADDYFESLTQKGPVLHSAVWGVVCDGPTAAEGNAGDDGTDNSTALLQIRSYMASQTATHWELHIDPGTGACDFEQNWWLLGVMNITLDAHDVWLRSTKDSAAGILTRPFANGRWDYEEYNGVTGVYSSRQEGYLIDTADSGAGTVTCSTASEAGNFSAGDRVMLHGFLQQDGTNPPNLRHFEWATVTDSDSGTGVVTLRDPIRYQYLSTWRDHDYGASGSWGAPRILNLARSGLTQPNFIEIRNADLGRGPGAESQGHAAGVQLDAEVLRLVNCKNIYYLWCGGNRLAELVNCDIINSDIDKIIDRLRLVDCTFRNTVDAATGVNSMEILSCDIRGQVFVCPRSLVARNNTITVDDSENFGAVEVKTQCPIDSLVIEGNTINGHGSLQHAFNPNNAVTMTVESAGSNGEIKVDGATAGNIAKIGALGVGHTLYSSDGSLIGRVESITWDGSDYVVAGDWEDTPSAAETISFWTYRGLSYRDNVTTPSVPFERYILPQCNATENGNVVWRWECKNRTISDLAGSQTNLTWRGKLRRVKLQIIKPYRGTNASGSYMNVQVNNGSNRIIGVDLEEVGTYEAREDGTTYNATAAPTTLIPINSAQHWTTGTFQVINKDSTNGDLSASNPENYPHWILEVELEPNVSISATTAKDLKYLAAEMVTAASPTLRTDRPSNLDSSSNAINATLGSGDYVEQIKTIVMTNASNSSTVSVTNHETSDPEVFTFDAVDECLVLIWMGTEWATLKATATT